MMHGHEKSGVLGRKMSILWPQVTPQVTFVAGGARAQQPPKPPGAPCRTPIDNAARRRADRIIAGYSVYGTIRTGPRSLAKP
jgi:hypothetical protein